MENSSKNKSDKNKLNKKHICIGLLAHVDAGKTTLSESLLYAGGAIRKMGRVDSRDAFLDTHALERERGITIFSKQAVLSLDGMEVTLLDTPGHVDFSPEMERTLQVLDYAILVISGADGVQGHTRTLWGLLRKYRIPVFLFINKMDQEGTDREALLEELRGRLEGSCVDFSTEDEKGLYEELALCGEAALEEFLETGSIAVSRIRRMIRERKTFPCYFGSALRSEGIDALLRGIRDLAEVPEYPQEFSARVYKISRDAQGNRLTHLKITGGVLRVKALIGEEKVNQIRIYSGEKYEAVSEVEAGTICALTGLTKTGPGTGLGAEEGIYTPVLEPVLTYQIRPKDGCDPALLYPRLLQLEEEEPQLHIVWEEEFGEIHVQIMGEVQLEILKSLILERFGVEVEFGQGNILYKETIADIVEGVGHFEPLRHYAEVHLLLEPGERGSGLQFESVCSEDHLDRNWQRLILTHLAEKIHRGVLTGAPVTDMKITLVAGRAHLKHTEGGDFRQAVYRAVRQGLMEAKSVLLEPYYEYRLEVPPDSVGRAMTDLERMHGEFEPPQSEGEMMVLAGKAPVAAMRDYQKEVYAYTRGNGRLLCMPGGYAPCHNSEEILEQTGYEPERDLANPAGSVFCVHGAGCEVPWYEVKERMHLPAVLSKRGEREIESTGIRDRSAASDGWIDTEEVDRIIEGISYANRRTKDKPIRKIPDDYRYKAPKSGKQEHREAYLLVDGYNVIFAWEDLRELAKTNIDGAKGRLLDLLCDYQGMKNCHLIVVFDAYRVQGHRTETFDYHNIHVVYTKEAETADQYIEKFAHEHGKKYQITVATSDGLEQIIIRGQGCLLLSARELREEMQRSREQMRENYPQSERGLSFRMDL